MTVFGNVSNEKAVGYWNNQEVVLCRSTAELIAQAELRCKEFRKKLEYVDLSCVRAGLFLFIYSYRSHGKTWYTCYWDNIENDYLFSQPKLNESFKCHLVKQGVTLERFSSMERALSFLETWKGVFVTLWLKDHQNAMYNSDTRCIEYLPDDQELIYNDEQYTWIKK